MDPNMAINLGGSLTSVTGLAVSLRQWLRSERAAEAKSTLEEYLEWLRRQNHQEILQAIEANKETIAELRGWIAGITTVLDHPRLEISAERGVQVVACGNVVAFSVVFRAVNVSRCQRIALQRAPNTTE